MKRTAFLLLFLLLVLHFTASPPTAAPAIPDVAPLRLSLTASPVEPLPGETVKISARISPRFDPERNGIRWTWHGSAGNTRKKSATEILFEAQNAPVTLTATLRDLLRDEDLETAAISVAPRSYTLAIRNHSQDRNKICLWNDTTKAIEEKTGKAVRSPVILEGVLDPVPPGNVRCLWTPNEGTAVISEDGNRAVVCRNMTGVASVSLLVLDKNGLELGRSEVSFDVDITHEALERSFRLIHGQALWEKALTLREKGELEAALIQAVSAAEELIEGGMKDEFLRDELERFSRARNRYFKALELGTLAASLWRDGDLEEALAKFREAQMFHAHPLTEKSIAELEVILKKRKEARIAAATAAREADQLAAEGKLREALGKYDESLRLYSDAAVRTVRAGIEGRLGALDRKAAAAKAQQRIALDLEARGDLESALAKITESQEIYPLPEAVVDVSRIRGRLQEHRQRREKATALGKEASALESRGLEGQGDPDVLKQALKTYRLASETWSDLSFDGAARRIGNHLDRIDAQVAQVGHLIREAAQLEQEGRMDEAMRRYVRAQNIRRTDGAQNKIADLERRMEIRKKRIKESRELYIQAVDLESRGKFDEALAAARKGESTFSDNALSMIVRRLQKTIDVRDEKTARASALADRGQEAWMRNDLEKALDLYIESDNVRHNEKTARTIQTLRTLVGESVTTAARAEELYREAVILERNSNFVTAEEKLRSSLALRTIPEAQALLKKVENSIAEENWIENLKTQPLSLRTSPSIPRVGERTVVRIESGAWTEDPGLAWRWRLTGNAEGDETLDGGRAYAFYPADDRPVTITLAALQAETGRELHARSLSVMAEPCVVTLVADEGTKFAKLWNENLKCLENVREFATRADIEVRAEISPLPDSPVSWLWSADPESTIPASQDGKTTVRRILPGISKLSVTARDSRGIALGSAQISLLIPVDRNDILRDERRARAWAQWLEAETQWAEGKYLTAMETAACASVLDPLAPEIANGCVQMKEDFGKMERSTRLLAESAWLLAAGRIEEAGEKTAEAQNLWPDVSPEKLLFEIEKAGEKNRENSMLAARLRAEAQAFLAGGSRVEALLRLQDSYLLEENDAVSKDVVHLIREIEEDRAKRREAGDLRNRGNILADRKHYSEALDFYSRSLRLYPDPYLRSYMNILQEKAAEEKDSREKAAALRREGDALMDVNRTEEALAKYRESLQIRHNDELKNIIDGEEKRIAETTASKLRKEAEKLVKSKKSSAALAKYRESLKFAYNEEAYAYVKKADAAEIKKRAEELTLEGDTFMRQKKPHEALERYRLALTKTPKDPILLEKLRKLELILKPAVAAAPASGNNFPGEASQEFPPDEPYADVEEQTSVYDPHDLKRADALFREGNILYREKKYREALRKYKDSYVLSQSPKLGDFIDRLETTLGNTEKANKLVQEGNAFYKTQNFKEALKKYRESLSFYKNSEVEAFILKLEPLAK